MLKAKGGTPMTTITKTMNILWVGMTILFV